MTRDTLLQTAEFNPAVKTYWLINWIIISALTLVGIPLLLISIPIAMMVCHHILRAMSAELYERKLVVRRGILFTVEKSIPLEKITDVAMMQGPLMRMLGLHRLTFETAGQSGNGALVSLVGIVEAAAFREAILRQKDQLQDGQSIKTEATGATSEMAELIQSVRNIEALLTEIVNRK